MPGRIAADRLLTILRSVCLAALAGGVGCVSLHRQPVAENVIESRQLSLRGMDALQRGDWPTAEEMFARAIAACPADELAHRRYAESLWRRGLHEQAIQHMQTSAGLAGDHSPVHVQLGEMYLSMGWIDRAWESAERAVLAQPQNEAAWALRGDVLGQQGHFAAAMTSYHRALALQPHYPHVQVTLCRLYLQQNRSRRALATIDSLASSHPPDAVPAEILALRGISLKQLARYDAAIEVLNEAIVAQPSAELFYELAETQFLAGEPDNARLALQTALSLAPSDTRARALHERLALGGQ